MHPTINSSQSERPTLSLILPAFNEADVIADAIQEADAALQQVADQYEIIVVDDGSSDTTASIVETIGKQNSAVRLIGHSSNQGYGAAIRSGFAAAKNDLVIFTDADCQFDLTELDRFVLLSNRYDIVCGYRIDRKDSALRCLYSRIYNLLVRTLLGTGVRDVDCALKMFHRDVAQSLVISGNGFLVNSEMLVQANRQGRSVVEVGVSHRPRTLGESTVSAKHIPKVLTSLARYWWNEVQFPPHPKTAVAKLSDEEASVLLTNCDRKLQRMQWGLMLIAAVFLFTNLDYPLIDRDETRYAEIPREMLATGNWILPQLNFQTYYDKPPLLYWLCAISFRLFGVNEAAARLVPALAALGTIASTIHFGSRFFDRRIGLITGVVLMLSVGFTFTSRYLLLDGLLTLFVSLSLFSAFEAMRPSSRRGSSLPEKDDGAVLPDAKGEREERLRCDSQRSSGINFGWWLLSGICIGLAFLTKGPLAIVLWLPPVFAYAWVSEATLKPRWWHYGVLFIVAASISVPWFVLVHLQDPTFLAEFFYTHNVARFAGEFHAKPFWYFVPVLLIAGHPWSFLTIPYLRFLFGRGEENWKKRSPAVGFLLLWSVWCFAFFSMSRCKLPTYLLPAAPALALMIGHYLNEVLQGKWSTANHFFASFWSARAATAATCMAAVGFVIYFLITADETTISIYAWAMLWTVLLVCSLILMSDRNQAKTAWGTATSVSFLFALMMMHQMLPAYSRSQTLFGDTSPLVGRWPTAERPSIATVAHEFSDVPFYLNRSDIPNFADIQNAGLAAFVSNAGRAILIIDDHVDAERVRDRLPARTKMVQIARRGSAQIYEVSAPVGTTRIAAESSAPSEESRR